MPRDDLEEALDELYPHLRGTHRMHDVLAARYALVSDEDDEEEVAAREAWDRHEEREIRDLAESRGTAEEVLGARAVRRSWNGESIREIARSLKVRQEVVIAYFLMFNTLGVDGLKGRGEKDKSGQTKAIAPASGKRSPFPLTSVSLDIRPFRTVEDDRPRR
jgi:hypothetical protein